MIPYHGTPISGPETQAVKFLARRHALVAFLYQQHMAIVASVCQSFVLDCSAYTAWKQGVEIDFRAYLRWVRHWHRHPGFDWAIIPDNITGTEEENDELLGAWPEDLMGVPVWHMHESIDRLKRLSEKYRVVALGSSGQFSRPNSRVWWDRMDETMDAVCDKNGVPPCQFHGLRMMDPRVFTKVPLKSADSTNVGVNVSSKKRFGIYVPPSESVRAEMIADRIEFFNSPATWSAI